MRLLLASVSPRRIELCRLAGIQCESMPVEVEEPPRRGESPRHYVERMARKKAETVGKSGARGVRPFVIGADTVVVAPGRKILGKPRDRSDARRMLSLLLGHEHHVLTGVCVARWGGPRRTAVVETLVAFREVRAKEIEAYLDTNEWQDKAGAYAVQGVAGARFVSRIVGSLTNVIGLPTVELRAMLVDLDVL